MALDWEALDLDLDSVAATCLSTLLEVQLELALNSATLQVLAISTLLPRLTSTS